MDHVLEDESTLTDRYQTTVPDTIRRGLCLNKRYKVHYKIMSDGTVVLSRVESREESDRALAGFLHLLAYDIKAGPQAVRALGKTQRERTRALV
ncbi:MAG: type II toxin-antitoxin system PrlF family antitoxin [Pseudomonadota bacterium]